MPITINGTGTISGLSVGGLPDGTVDQDTLASGVGGKVLEQKSAKKLGTQSTDSTSYVDITDLTITITPKASNSKFYIAASFNVNKENYTALFKLLRDSTEIGLPAGTGGENHICNVYTANNNGSWRCTLQWDDTPGDTSSHTYKLQMRTDGGGDPTLHIGGHHDNSSSYTTPSYMTVMEIAP